MEHDKLVPIKSFSNEIDARVASAHLESEGIVTYIKKDDCGGNYPQLQISSGVQLLVNPDAEQKAKNILSEIESDQASKQAVERKKTSNGRGVFFMGFFLLGLAAGYLLFTNFDKVRKTSRDVIETDTNGDGKPDIFSYYRNNKLLRIENDRDYDGVIDAWHRYNDNRIANSEYDDNFDGKIDGWADYENENDFKLKIDSDFNGKPDATVYVVHQLEARVDWQPNGSSIIVKREVFENAIKKEEFIDSDRDGNFDLKLIFDSFGNEVQRTKLPAIVTGNRHH